MNIQSILLLVLILALFIAALIHIIKKGGSCGCSGSGRCSGDCGHCHKCGKAHKQRFFK